MEIGGAVVTYCGQDTAAAWVITAALLRRRPAHQGIEG